MPMERKIYIYQDKDWPNWAWDQDRVMPVLGRVRMIQGKLLGKMEGIGITLKQQASLDTLTEEIVKSSDIEGEKLPEDQVRSSIARKLGLDLAGMVDSPENVDGVVTLMLDATQNFQDSLTHDRLFGWHAALFPTGYSGNYKIQVAQYRNDNLGPMEVVSGAMGKRKVHYVAPEANQLNEMMEEFLGWFNSNHLEDPVIVAAIAHLWFIVIHPFDDGNGRITRALTDMQLARSDGSTQRFYSMSSQIRATRKEYYTILEKTQQGGLDITKWLLWFLETMELAIVSSEEKLKEVLNKAKFWDRHNSKSINDRQVKILNMLLNGSFVGNVTTVKWSKMNKCSHDTALRDIQSLIDLGMLKKEGEARATHYLINY